jgi:RND superfamily putative drug exporter
MSSLLHRLGLFCYRRRRAVAAVWAVLAVGLAAGAFALGRTTGDTLTIPGTESQRAMDALGKEFPAASGASGTVVVEAHPGRTLDDIPVRAATEATVARAEAIPGVIVAVGPYQSGAISRDRATGLIIVSFDAPDQRLSAQAKAGWDALAGQSRSGLVRVVPGGGVSDLVRPGVNAAEGLGVAIAAVVLVVTFGSLAATGMTLLMAFVSVAAGVLGLLLLGAVVDVASTTPLLSLMLGLAVGIDYSLFISSRHRAQLADGIPPWESVGRATASAGGAVVFAGATVIVALVGLTLVGVPFLGAIGLAGAGTVLAAVLVAITLLPAMLGFLGHRALPHRQRQASARTQPTTDLPAGSRPGVGYRWGWFVTRVRVPVVVACLLGLAVLALPLRDVQLALPDSGTAPRGSAARIAYDEISREFGPGVNGPLLVAVRAATPTATASLAEHVAAAARAVPGVVVASTGDTSASGTTTLVTVVPSTAPTSDETAHLVDRLRATIRPLANAAGGSVAVTGATAVAIDTSARLAAALPRYLAVVVGISIILLFVAFRSLYVPIKAAAGFVLSLGATLGATVAVFQWGWFGTLVGIDTPGPLLNFLPIVLLAIMFGLAMDYEFFIVSRVREEFTQGRRARQAVIEGVGHGARVVTAAALIMISVFGGFVFAPSAILKTVGFGLAFGVLVDAFLVRMTLVPAVLALLGDRTWRLPRSLDRLLRQAMP